MLIAYLRVRSTESSSSHLWLTDEATPLTYWGGQSVFRRLKVRSGIDRLHPHLLRHTFAQVALERGAERAAVQDMLGHSTEAMTRRYAGSVRQQSAARMMPKYSPLSKKPFGSPAGSFQASSPTGRRRKWNSP